MSDVSRELRAVTMAGLPGTKVRMQPAPEPFHVQQATDHVVIHWGWTPRSKHANSACGCAIMISKSFFRAKSIEDIFSPPPALQGRGGCIVIKQGPIHIKFIVAYFLPRKWDATAGEHKRGLRGTFSSHFGSKPNS